MTLVKTAAATKTPWIRHDERWGGAQHNPAARATHNLKACMQHGMIKCYLHDTFAIEKI